MLINPLIRTRSGSVSFEAILILPILVALVLMSRVVAESFLLRADAASDVRQAVVAKADTDVCGRAQTDAIERADLERSIYVFCWTEDAEQTMRQERPFEDAMRRAGREASFLLEDVGQEMRAETALATARGRAEFQSPDFLHARDAARTSQSRAWPSYRMWTEDQQPWRDGLDPAMWRQITRLGAAKDLFPRVFPAAIR